MRSRIAAVALVSAIVSSCATLARVDEQYTAADPDFERSFAKPSARCATAAREAFKQLGAEVETAKGNDLITNRYTAFEYATSSGAVSSGGAASSTAVLRRQALQIYARIEPQGGGCRVRVTRVRAWENNMEFDTLNVGYTKKAAVEPFFRNLEEAVSL